MAHIPHIHVPPPWAEGALPIDPSALHHLRRALRRSDGDPVTYTDGAGVLGEGRLDGDRIARGDETWVVRPERPLIAVAPPAQKDRARFLVEKVAELGTLELWWLRTRFGEGRPPSPEKARAWSRSALEQSRAAWLMEVGETPVDLADLPAGTVFADRTGTPAVRMNAASCVAVGAEAGWAPGEIPDDAPRVALGETVLRVETAAMVVATLANLPLSWNDDHSEW